MFKFKEVHVSAPSKVILHGEHAVVYGCTAVAASLDLRTRMRIKPHESRVAINFPDVGLTDSWELEQLRALFKHMPEAQLNEVDQAYVERIMDFLKVDQSNLQMASVVCFLYLYGRMMGEEEPGILPMEIWVESEIPLGAGLGSSAALSVCLAAGLTAVKHQVQGLDKNIINHPNKQMREEVCQLAFLSEKILHGNPSGIDNSISTYGGMCTFVKGRHTSLPVSQRLRILLVNTNRPRNTKDMVGRVRHKYQAYPKIIPSILEAISGVGQTFLDTLHNMDKEPHNLEQYYRNLEDLMEMNQALLSSLGVSHESLDEICRTFKKHGMRGKMTGAGGGGFAIALIAPAIKEETVTAVQRELDSLGYTCSQATIGVPGFSVELATQQSNHST